MPGYSFPQNIVGPVNIPAPDEMFPVPEMPTFSVSNRVASTSLEGGSYFLRKSFIFNRFLFRVNAFAGAPTAKILIYQASSAEAGIANLKASFTAVPITAVANKTATPDQVQVRLEEGLIFLLIGRDSAAGSFTHLCWDVPFASLIASAVDTNTHPMNFTTAILATTSPTTFNPRQSAGGSALASFTAVSPVMRFMRL